jgi:hypothetical protein
MANRDTEWGILVVIVATFFLFMGLDLFRVDVIDSSNQGASVLIAFVLVAVGVYLISKK